MLSHCNYVVSKRALYPSFPVDNMSQFAELCEVPLQIIETAFWLQQDNLKIILEFAINSNLHLTCHKKISK
jgi:hypothetical protein